METQLENREIVAVEILAAAAGRSRKDVLAAGRSHASKQHRMTPALYRRAGMWYHKRNTTCNGRREPDMNLQQLYYFQKIAECQQYTLAARELHVTQATLSYAITNLEQELGARLFERKGKTVSLTPCGTAYLDCVGEALLALERGRQAVRDTALAAKAMVRISYLESVKHLILRLMADMCAGGEDPDFALSCCPPTPQ